ncbi:methylphosphotriester-DNA--protein-cysteine methyltransferase family protein [Candidatus Sumerlaeota bacterium]|nr:methylphosphotriester-DNA--protein-cysteine methyltransferase family protein [Candidatus Sumerlaeota bacterium]
MDGVSVATMPPDFYKAYASRDPLFDGVFFVGITSTGIYCRPVCRARTAMEANCRFFSCAEDARKAGFRACLRCRPELEPGSAPIDDSRRIASLIVARLAEPFAVETSVRAMAEDHELSPRQIRRIVRKELGLSPRELLNKQRLQLARKLLKETDLRIIDVAYASGFASLRRFNDAFRRDSGLSPSSFRKTERLVKPGSQSARQHGTSGLGNDFLLVWCPALDDARTGSHAPGDHIKETAHDDHGAGHGAIQPD